MIKNLKKYDGRIVTLIDGSRLYEGMVYVQSYKIPCKSSPKNLYREFSTVRNYVFHTSEGELFLLLRKRLTAEQTDEGLVLKVRRD